MPRVVRARRASGRQREHVGGRDEHRAAGRATSERKCSSTAPGSWRCSIVCRNTTASAGSAKLSTRSRTKRRLARDIAQARVLVGLGVGVDADHAGGRRARARPSRSPRRRPCRSRAARARARRSTRRRPDGGGTSSSPRARRAASARRSAPAAARPRAGRAARSGPAKPPLGWTSRDVSGRCGHAGLEDAGTAREYMVRAVPPALSAEEIRDANTRYHDVAADHYDSKWGIDFGELGRSQVLGEGAQGARPRAEPLPRLARDRLWDRLLHPQPAARGADRRGDLQRHLAGDARDAAGQRRAARARGRRPSPPTPSSCRSRTRASTWCSATRCSTTSPTCHARSPSSSACSRRAARCCSRASPPATATASRACPSASASAVAPLWRRAIGAAAHRRRAPADSRTRRSRASSTCTPSRPASSRGSRARRGFAGRARQRRGAAGELVRVDQPHARGDRRPRRGAVGLAPVRLPRLPAAAGARPPAARVAAAGGDLLQPDARRAQARRA